MWDNAEVAGLLDREGRIALISRNEREALVKHVVGKRAVELLHPGSVAAFEKALAEVLRGKSTYNMLAATADEGYVFWFKLHMVPSPASEAPVLFHSRLMPREWQNLSQRERDVIEALHKADMNPKRAARNLGMSVHTLNAHRRSISKKCNLRGIGDFWVFVERCR